MKDARLWLGEDPFECAMEMDEPEDTEVEDSLRELSNDELAYLLTVVMGEVQRRLNEEDEDDGEDEDEDDYWYEDDDEDDWDEDEWDLEEGDGKEWDKEEEDDDDYYVSCSPLWGRGTFLEE